MARKRLSLNEKSKGLWHNIHAKRKRGEKMNPKGHPDAPTSKEMKMAQEAIQRRMDRMVIIATDPATGRKVVKIAPKKEILIGKGKQESVQVDEVAPLLPMAVGAIRAVGAGAKAYRAYSKARKSMALQKPSGIKAAGKVIKNRYDQGVRMAQGLRKSTKSGALASPTSKAKSAAIKSKTLKKTAGSIGKGIVLGPAKVSMAAVDKSWKMAGKTAKTIGKKPSKAKLDAYQHDPVGTRVKNYVLKPAAVSTAYGQGPFAPALATKDAAFNLARGGEGPVKSVGRAIKKNIRKPFSRTFKPGKAPGDPTTIRPKSGGERKNTTDKV